MLACRQQKTKDLMKKDAFSLNNINSLHF